MTASAPRAVRTTCSLFYFFMRVRDLVPALVRSVAISVSLIGLMTNNVHGQGASISKAPTRKANVPVCY